MSLHEVGILLLGFASGMLALWGIAIIAGNYATRAACVWCDAWGWVRGPGERRTWLHRTECPSNLLVMQTDIDRLTVDLAGHTHNPRTYITTTATRVEGRSGVANRLSHSRRRDGGTL